jgi:hypothetical protein
MLNASAAYPPAYYSQIDNVFTVARYRHDRQACFTTNFLRIATVAVYSADGVMPVRLRSLLVTTQLDNSRRIDHGNLFDLGGMHREGLGTVPELVALT